MKKHLLVFKAVCLLLLCAISINLFSCSTDIEATDLMEGVSADYVRPLNDMRDENIIAVDFALRLFKEGCDESGNVLISPLSVMYALSMVANGAEGETLAEMESTLGMTKDELNRYLYSYVRSLPREEGYQVTLENSIWLKDLEGFSVEPAFLKTNASYYGADVYKAAFDRQTVKDINNWIESKTDGGIRDMLDEISDNSVMYIINALLFEADWEEEYINDQLHDHYFTREDGTRQKVEMMFEADLNERNYLEDESATGFIKYFKDRSYAFVALLPNEGLALSEYISSLDGETVHALLDGAQSYEVHSAIPRFKTEYGSNLNSMLENMGMSRAFDPFLADFDGIGMVEYEDERTSLFISRVLHETFIEVGPRGAKAGAATVVEVGDGSADIAPNNIKTVRLDRPFVYMIIDCENRVPLFIGAQREI